MVIANPWMHSRVRNANADISSAMLHLLVSFICAFDRAGNLRMCERILGLRPAGGATWVVSGCIYKQMKLKPSVLDQFSGERSIEPPAPRANYTSDDDSLILEDESGRVVLTAGRYRGIRGRSAEIPLRQLVQALVTGVVIAVKGQVLETGEFAVDDVCVPGLALSPASPGYDVASIPPPLVPQRPAGRQPVFVLLVSGLSAGVPVTGSHPLALQLLADYIAGLTGSAREAAGVARIARVIIAGGLVGKVQSNVDRAARTVTAAGAGAGAGSSSSSSAAGAGAGASSTSSVFSDRAISVAEAEAAVVPMRNADLYLSQLCSSVPVDMMPGADEPASHLLPQQPLHSCLLPQASRYSTLRSVTNPYSCDLGIDGAASGASTGSASASSSAAGCGARDGSGVSVRLLGHSGQPLDDILKYAGTAHPTQPGDEMGLRAEGLIGRTASGGSGGDGADADGDDAEMDGGAGAGAGAGSSSSSSSSAGQQPDGSPMVDDAVAAAVASTSADKALQVQAGTGAGADLEVRAKAGGGGSEVASSMSTLDLLTNTLYWRHLAPTAPDTLACHPFTDTDPFIIAQLPNLYFAGQQKGYGSRLVTDASGQTKVRVVCVPDFCHTHTAVLVDISSPNLDTEPICFAIGSTAPASAAPAASTGGAGGGGSSTSDALHGQGLKLRPA